MAHAKIIKKNPPAYDDFQNDANMMALSVNREQSNWSNQTGAILLKQSTLSVNHKLQRV